MRTSSSACPALANRRALIALAAAGLLWGLTIPLSKVALGYLDAAWLTVVRFGLAAPILAWIARRHLRDAFTPAIAAWGGLGYGMVIVLQNLGIERTSVSHAALVCGAVPALVAVASLAAGRGRSGPIAWAGFAVALAGVGLVAGSGGAATPAGDLLVLGSAGLSAMFIVAQGDNLEGRDAIAVTAVQMLAAALVALPIALLAGTTPQGAPGTGELLVLVALCSAGSLLPYALYAYGQARVSAETAGAFVNLEPLVGAAAGAMAFGDPFGGAQLAGALAIVGGLLLSLQTPGGGLVAIGTSG
jgi:drug/metabolite transporter (DMT)-like permease